LPLGYGFDLRFGFEAVELPPLLRFYDRERNQEFTLRQVRNTPKGVRQDKSGQQQSILGKHYAVSPPVFALVTAATRPAPSCSGFVPSPARAGARRGTGPGFARFQVCRGWANQYRRAFYARSLPNAESISAIAWAGFR